MPLGSKFVREAEHGAFDMSAVVPSGIRNSPVESPMPVTCFMKDSNEAFLAVAWITQR